MLKNVEVFWWNVTNIFKKTDTDKNVLQEMMILERTLLSVVVQLELMSVFYKCHITGNEENPSIVENRLKKKIKLKYCFKMPLWKVIFWLFHTFACP